MKNRQEISIVLLVLFAAACGAPGSKGGPKKGVALADDATTNASIDQIVIDTPDDSVDGNNITPQAVCGDGVVDAGEGCDGPVDPSCQDLGFDGGTTSCSATCEVDSTACTRISCGDGIIQAAETCDDGVDNGAYDACSDNCSGLAQYCGDSIANGPEVCDGSAPIGVSCTSYGFNAGIIGCSTACEVDTSGCTTCGDGIVDSGEACDDGASNGTYGSCNAVCTAMGATCGDGVVNGPEDCDGTQLGGLTCGDLGAGRGPLACDSTCGLMLDACTLAPDLGELIVSEIMQNPAVDLDNDGEFFEVYNTTSGALDLDGCTIESGTATGPESFVILAQLVVPAGGYAVLARSTNAPFVPDYVYGSQMNLNNSVDHLAIICPQPNGGSVEIDRVSYDDGATFPDPVGASMSLNPNRLNANDNDFGSNWCESSSSFGVGDLGTPGAPNDACF